MFNETYLQLEKDIFEGHRYDLRFQQFSRFCRNSSLGSARTVLGTRPRRAQFRDMNLIRWGRRASCFGSIACGHKGRRGVQLVWGFSTT